MRGNPVCLRATKLILIDGFYSGKAEDAGSAGFRINNDRSLGLRENYCCLNLGDGC